MILKKHTIIYGVFIDKEEQNRRFKEREENPEKQWKITEEDWRNRAKWDEYETMRTVENPVEHCSLLVRPAWAQS